MKVIVYNAHDGGVDFCRPSIKMLSIMCNGGFDLWQMQPKGFADRQIASMVARGIDERVAHRYAITMLRGGCTTAEALEIIRDRDCTPRGTAIELWGEDDLPTDRWFRLAWHRSHNGGPISINLKKAKTVQMRRIGNAVIEENKKRERELIAPLEYDRDLLRGKIMQARDEIELRSIWPKELQ